MQIFVSFCFFSIISFLLIFVFFFFNVPATTEIYTLSLHDALPISRHHPGALSAARGANHRQTGQRRLLCQDRKSTRLNSSHGYISYAVFCLKKKKIILIFNNHTYTINFIENAKPSKRNLVL